jgi:hypothetical protein
MVLFDETSSDARLPYRFIQLLLSTIARDDACDLRVRHVRLVGSARSSCVSFLSIEFAQRRLSSESATQSSRLADCIHWRLGLVVVEAIDAR